MQLLLFLHVLGVLVVLIRSEVTFGQVLGLARVPRSLLGSQMIDFEVASALYSKATLEHFHVRPPRDLLWTSYGPPRLS